MDWLDELERLEAAAGRTNHDFVQYKSELLRHARDLIASARRCRELERENARLRARSRIILNDPFRILLDVFAKLFPHTPAPTIQFVSDLHQDDDDPLGQTTFPDDGSTPLVDLDASMPLDGAVDILAHELAHVACEDLGLNKPGENPHTQSWQDIYDRLHAEFCEMMEQEAAEAAQKGGA